MNFNSAEVGIRPIKFAGEACLSFDFKGKLSEKAANQASDYWSSELDNHPQNNYTFIWDCSEMTGFELSARKVWYDYMNVHRKQISSVIVISGNIMIRSAAKVMLEFFGVSSKVLKSKEQLEELEHQLETV